MKTKFTKGPWEFVIQDGYSHIMADYESIMSDTTYYPWVPTNPYDWHLIAAAPDLYEALEDLLYYGQDGSPRHYVTAIDNAKKALAKARGEV